MVSAYDAVMRRKREERMAKNVQCSITISEVDGKLSIIAKIPDGAEKSIAGVLAEALVGKSAEIMNEVLGEGKVVQRVIEN
jgi:hypothetical protein